MCLVRSWPVVAHTLSQTGKEICVVAGDQCHLALDVRMCLAHGHRILFRVRAEDECV